MTLKKDKQKVLGEIFGEDRVRSFLELQPPAGVDADFHVLERSYRGMGAENFTTLLELFTAAGRNLSATNPQGQTLLEILSEHQNSSAYQAALLDRLKP